MFSVTISIVKFRSINSPPLDEFGKQIRARIKKEIGLVVGMGFGPTKKLAKLANHAAKKWTKTEDIIDISSFAKQQKLMALVEVGDVGRVGGRIEKRLNAMDTNTELDLSRANLSMICKNFNVVLERTVRELNGDSCIALEDAAPL